MKYYYIEETRDIDVIGHYPQTMRTNENGYNVDADNSERKVLYDFFPNFEPNYGLDLHPKSVSTDVLDKSTLPFGFVVSQKLKDILHEFKLPPHRFYPVNVYGTNKRYYWFHQITGIWNYIDFDSTKIEVFHKFKFNVEEVKSFHSFNEIKEFEKTLPRQNALRIGSIVLQENFPNYDLFDITWITWVTIISERLKQRLLEANISGFGIALYNKIQLSSKTSEIKSDVMNVYNYQWPEIKKTLDALQTASGQTYGKSKLKELLKNLDEIKKITIQKEGSDISIENRQQFQDLINTYDSNIKISEIE